MSRKFTANDLASFKASVAEGNLVDVRTWLDEGIPCDFVTESTSPLIEAATNGDLVVMEMLVNAGAKVNFIADPQKGGPAPRTALNAAVLRMDKLAITWLLDNGANPGIADMSGRSSVHMLLQMKNTTSEWQAFVPYALNRMLDAGAPINQQTRRGRTPLAMAVEGGCDPAIIGLLMRWGADPCITDSRGNAPIHLATGLSSGQIFTTLIENGAKVDTRNATTGQTPLHLYWSDASADAIYAADPDLEAADHDGHTALLTRLLAIKDPTELPDAVSRLLAAGASLDTPDLKGLTPRDVIETGKLKAVASAVAAREARNTIADVIRRTRQASRP